ncbi:MAG: hypothetical protein H0V76_05245 [Blastocatellia bacterium]|nr:hypothetical protein [Blastocatellia bacterium]
MTDFSETGAIIAQYVKHGWELKFCIAREQDAEALRHAIQDQGFPTDIRTGNMNGLWFSRRSLPDRVAWELRRLTDPPFALVTMVPDTFTVEQHAAALREIEARMAS